MARSNPHDAGKPDIGEETGGGPEQEPITGTPRWVEVAAVIAVALVVAVVIMLIVGIGNHGPGRHTLSSDSRSQTPASAVTTRGEPQP
jgi:hypothetical protein